MQSVQRDEEEPSHSVLLGDDAARHHESVRQWCYDCEMNSRCRDCLAGLDHCHGALIRHRLHRAECTDENCTGPELTSHAFVLDCDAVGCDCANTDAPSELAI